MNLLDAMRTAKPFREVGSKNDMTYLWDGLQLWWWIDEDHKTPSHIVTITDLLKTYEVVDLA